MPAHVPHLQVDDDEVGRVVARPRRASRAPTRPPGSRCRARSPPPRPPGGGRRRRWPPRWRARARGYPTGGRPKRWSATAPRPVQVVDVGLEQDGTRRHRDAAPRWSTRPGEGALLVGGHRDQPGVVGHERRRARRRRLAAGTGDRGEVGVHPVHHQRGRLDARSRPGAAGEVGGLLDRVGAGRGDERRRRWPGRPAARARPAARVRNPSSIPSKAWKKSTASWTISAPATLAIVRRSAWVATDTTRSEARVGSEQRPEQAVLEEAGEPAAARPAGRGRCGSAGCRRRPCRSAPLSVSS